MHVSGVLDEPGTVTVNGEPAKMLPGNAFESVITTVEGVNGITVEAQDLQGNLRTNEYEVNVVGRSASYTYDPNGNLVSKTEDGQTWTYEWNAENQLVAVERDGTEIARFAYDPLGRRVEKVAAGITTQYTYDGEDVLRTIDSDGTTYTYVQGTGIDEPLAREDASGNLTYYHSDGLGSVVKMTDPSGAVVHEYRYDAWGNIESGEAEPGFAFTGREWEPETGLYYYRARYYDPAAGRFISEDPLGLSAGINTYTYTANNPARWIDPQGYDYITYSPASRTLQWVTDSGAVLVSLTNVVTGPVDRGALPHGHYKGYELVRTTEGGMVCPNESDGWKLRLDPQFDTRDGQYPVVPRTGLLIHPDGNDPGTAGCVGVPCGVAADAVEMLLEVYVGATNSTIDVYVGGTPEPWP
jgi:RHS repeat-associated protein